ncbi:MAG: transposase [Clostridiales bacterium]|jgi:Transposase.|nr:transposase [Clostridiales bacterium]PZM87983.1 MAG: transposase [[Clostridium] cellulosi]
MGKSPHSAEWKLRIINEYLSGRGSYDSLAQMYGIDSRTLRAWVHKYLEQGASCFVKREGNAHYSKEFKTMCVKAVLGGEGSVDDIVAKYNISAREVLRQWIKRYNANKELKDYDPKREVYMANARRKTTLEERKKITEYCIAHGYDYKGTAALYDVSYSQVYTWVKKYLESGEDGLTDRRGKHKSDDEVDELERLRRENLRLKRQLEERDMVVELLKKVKEFEGM